jgi:hypothetical protein
MKDWTTTTQEFIQPDFIKVEREQILARTEIRRVVDGYTSIFIYTTSFGKIEISFATVEECREQYKEILIQLGL